MSRGTRRGYEMKMPALDPGRRREDNQNMEAKKNDDQNTERGSSEGQQSQETRPASKLRDLKPEKDPMGSGNTGASGSDVRRV